MKCVVTGGAGFIGSNLALELDKNGNEVIVIDTFLKGNKKNLEGFKGKIIKGNEKKIFDLKGIETVFHLAAITDTTVTDKEEMYKNNLDGFKIVLDFCQENNCKLVYASSGAVYGVGKVPMKEDQELNPLNVYGESKVEMDKLAEKSFFGKTLVGLRYFNVFGPKENFKGKMASMIYQLALQMKNGKSPRIFKYGEQKRDHIYIRDVVEATIKAASYNGFNIFNIATGITTTFNQIIEFLNDAMETDYKTEYFDNPYTDQYQHITLADISNAEKELKFISKYSVRVGVEEYIEWLNHVGWYKSQKSSLA